MKYFFLLLFVSFLLTNCQTKSQVTDNSTIDFEKNEVVAHRGAWKKQGLPENSIAALQEAIRLGCTGSEFDVWMTADDSLVVNHDPEFFGKMIEETTFADLQNDQLSNGEVIPTVEAYLREGMRQKNTRLVLEIKPSKISKERGLAVAEKVMATVQKLNAAPWMMYISFDYDIVKKILAIAPEAEVAYLNGDIAPAKLKEDGVNGLDYHFSVFRKNPDWIQSAKDNKVALNAWTVNDTTTIDWLLGEGFDYITTNEPELVFERKKSL